MNVIYNGLVYGVWFLSTYFVVLLLLVLFTTKKKLFETREPLGREPKVSIVVPAYNEEASIAQTIESLKKLEYRQAEFIVLSDGSKDGTSAEVHRAIAGDKRFTFIDRKDNWGKAASLNQGMGIARGEFVACMDADSVVEPKMIDKILPYFKDDQVGAVTVSVELKNPKSWLHRIIDIEYIIGLSLFLKVFSTFNCVFVTPGPFSVYRKKAIDAVGGFDPENVTEDFEIAYRLHKKKWRIENCLDAKVETICPPTFKQIYVQRRRWYSGALQTLTKHRDVMFNKKLGIFGYFVPINFLLVGAGMMLFYASTYLLLSRIYRNFVYFNYTNFNFLERMFEFKVDLLRTGQISMIGMCAVVLTITLMMIGLYVTRKRFSQKKLGMLGFPFMFFLYQIFWTGAIVAYLRGKSIKWR